MKKLLLMISLIVFGLLIVSCAPAETKSGAVSSEEKLEGDLTPAEIAQLPPDAKPQKMALSGQATAKWENCVDTDNTASKWNDKEQLLTKSSTTYEGGSNEDKCYTWYKGTPKEKTRLIEGVCKQVPKSSAQDSISKFNYWYADCDVAFGKGAKCVDGACVKPGTVNLVLSNIIFMSNGVDVDKDTEALDFTMPVQVSFDVTNEGDAVVDTGYVNEVKICQFSSDSCHLPNLEGYDTAKLLIPQETQHFQVSFNFKEDDAKYSFKDNKVKLAIFVDGDGQVKESNENDNMYEMVLNVVNAPTSTGGSELVGISKEEAGSCSNFTITVAKKQTLSDRYSFIDGYDSSSNSKPNQGHFPALLSGDNLHKSTSDDPYLQVLFIGPSMYSGYVDYLTDNYNLKKDYLYFMAGYPLFRYRLEFSQTSASIITDEYGSKNVKGTFLYDFIGAHLNMLGRNYTIVSAVRPGTSSSLGASQSVKLVLMPNPVFETLEEGVNKTFTYNNKSYNINLTFVKNDASAVQFTVNGEKTGFLKRGEFYILNDLKTRIGVADILYQTYAGGVHTTKFFLGSTMIELRDDQITDTNEEYNLKVNSNSIDGAKVRIMGVDDNNTLTLSTIEVNMTAKDNYFVGLGKTLGYTIYNAGDENETLFTNSWDVLFKSQDPVSGNATVLITKTC